MNDSFAFIRSILSNGDISDATKVSILKVALDNITNSPLVSPCGDDTEQYRISLPEQTQVNNKPSSSTNSVLVPDLSLASGQILPIDNWPMERLEPWAKWWRKVGLKVGPNSWELCKRIYEQYGEAAVLRARDRAVLAGGWPDKVEAAILTDMEPKKSKNSAILDMMFDGYEPTEYQLQLDRECRAEAEAIALAKSLIPKTQEEIAKEAEYARLIAEAKAQDEANRLVRLGLASSINPGGGKRQ